MGGKTSISHMCDSFLRGTAKFYTDPACIPYVYTPLWGVGMSPACPWCLFCQQGAHHWFWSCQVLQCLAWAMLDMGGLLRWHWPSSQFHGLVCRQSLIQPSISLTTAAPPGPHMPPSPWHQPNSTPSSSLSSNPTMTTPAALRAPSTSPSPMPLSTGELQVGNHGIALWEV